MHDHACLISIVDKLESSKISRMFIWFWFLKINLIAGKEYWITVILSEQIRCYASVGNVGRRKEE